MSKRATLIWTRAVAGVFAVLGLCGLLDAVMLLVVELPKHRSIPANELPHWHHEFVAAFTVVFIFGIVFVVGAWWLWKQPARNVVAKEEGRETA